MGTQGQLGGFDQLLDSEPTPEFLVIMDEQQRRLFDALPDPSQKEVARLRFEGFSNDEIAEQVGMSLRSVERKLKIIREIWTDIMRSHGESGTSA
jgi:RNA polymerase sigma factor (sigma-70 family)